MPAEYAPLAIRQRAAALASASNWIFTFLVVEITPVSIGNIGYRTYIYFCSMYFRAWIGTSAFCDVPETDLSLVFNFCFLPLIYFFYPETQNLTLEQIDKLFTGDKVMLRWTPSMGEIGDVGEVKGGVVEQHLEKQVA